MTLPKLSVRTSKIYYRYVYVSVFLGYVIYVNNYLFYIFFEKCSKLVLFIAILQHCCCCDLKDLINQKRFFSFSF